MSRRSRSNSSSAGSDTTLVSKDNIIIPSKTNVSSNEPKTTLNGKSSSVSLHGMHSLHGMNSKSNGFHKPPTVSGSNSHGSNNNSISTKNNTSSKAKKYRTVDAQMNYDTPTSSSPIGNSKTTQKNKSSSAANGTPVSISNESLNVTDADQSENIIKPRNKLIHILILKSLNKTFETKYLVVPFKPDALKLGRPVSNNNNNNNNNNANMNSNNGNGNNNNNNNSNKTGNSSGTNNSLDKNNKSEARPDNGHFDSRILSRNHASISCDPITSIIYLKDLHSSNGTYLNGDKLKPETDVEIKIGDVITLGADISSNGEHKKISALVEDINILPLVDDEYGSFSSGNIQDNSNITSKSLTQRAAFEAAMFGDVNDELVSDEMWGQENDLLSGLFFSNSAGTSSSFMNVLKALNEEIVLERAEQSKLKSIEQFLSNYTTNLEYLNKLKAEKNDHSLAQFQNNLQNQLTSKYETLLNDEKEKFKILQREHNSLKGKLENLESEEIKNLKFKIEDLNTMLQVEKYKHGEISNNDKYSKDDFTSYTTTEKETNSNMNNGLNNIYTQNGSNESLKNGSKEKEETPFESKNVIEEDVSDKGTEALNFKKSLADPPLIMKKKTKSNREKNLHTIAYLASISVVGVFTAFVAYSQNK